jgi:hypothetical protein
VLDKFAPVQMLDAHFPTTDGRTLILSRYTELTADQKTLVQQLKLDLPPQPRRASPRPTNALSPSVLGPQSVEAECIRHFNRPEKGLLLPTGLGPRFKLRHYAIFPTYGSKRDHTQRSR